MSCQNDLRKWALITCTLPDYIKCLLEEYKFCLSDFKDILVSLLVLLCEVLVVS